VSESPLPGPSKSNEDDQGCAHCYSRLPRCAHIHTPTDDLSTILHVLDSRDLSRTRSMLCTHRPLSLTTSSRRRQHADASCCSNCGPRLTRVHGLRSAPGTRSRHHCGRRSGQGSSSAGGRKRPPDPAVRYAVRVHSTDELQDEPDAARPRRYRESKNPPRRTPQASSGTSTVREPARGQRRPFTDSPEIQRGHTDCRPHWGGGGDPRDTRCSCLLTRSHRT
jgi:hypothetical protein